MAWVAVDEDGEAWLYERKPHKNGNQFVVSGGYSGEIDLDNVYAILGRHLTWQDEPVELKEGEW